MHTVYRLIKSLLDQKKADIPGWLYIVGLIIGLIGLIVLIYIAVRAGKISAEQISGLE